MGRKAVDLIGQKFGNLIVLERDFSKKNDNAYWICKCDCGKILSVKGTYLRTGRTKSCGCLNQINLINQKFGYLTVLERDFSKTGKVYWICKCDCGNIISVRGSSLKDGHTRSCGCINSKGENKIKDILSSLKIDFIQQKTFDNLKYKDNLKFDFFLPDYNCCIEYNGIQHYKAVEHFGGILQFKKQKEKDNIKRQWCKENNIQLIEIPYTDYNKINEDYIKSRL